MKRKLAMLLVLVMVITAGCASGVSEEPEFKQALSEEQMEMLGISQEEFDSLSAEEQAELQEILKDIEAEEAAANAQTTPSATEQEINPEEDVQKYLEELPALPEGDRDYNYEWSDRLDRITYYIITIESVPEKAVSDYLYLLEAEYGYLSGGKELWNEETQTVTYEYRTDTSIIYVETSLPDENGNVTVSFWISYNPYK